MKKKITAILLMILLLWGNALAGQAEYDPVIVRVGEISYPRSQVMEVLKMSMSVYATTGSELDEATVEGLKTQTVAAFLEQGIMENKLRELGMDQLSPEDEEELSRRADETYAVYLDAYATAIMQQYGCDENKAKRAAPTIMDLEGINRDLITQMERTQLLKERITGYITADVPRLTDEEVEAWYREKCVEPCEERYAGNLAAFEQEVVLGGTETFYVPEGYRYIQNILFLPERKLTEQVYLLQKDLEDARKEAERLDNALYGVRLLGEDDSEAVKALEEGREKVAGLEEQLEAIYNQMAEPFAEQAEQLKARLEAGESFEALRKEFDTNPEPQEAGYPIHAGSTLWEERFFEAALSLEKPGDWTGPVLTGNGLQFLLYAGDLPQGALELDDESFEYIRKEAQAEADDRLMLSYAYTWKSDYKTEMHPEWLILQ